MGMNWLKKLVAWVVQAVAGHVLIQALAIVPISYAFGWVRAAVLGATVPEWFTLPPYFWFVLSVMLSIVLIPPAFIWPVVDWYKRNRYRKEEIDRRLKEKLSEEAAREDQRLRERVDKAHLDVRQFLVVIDSSFAPSMENIVQDAVDAVGGLETIAGQAVPKPIDVRNYKSVKAWCEFLRTVRIALQAEDLKSTVRNVK